MNFQLPIEELVAGMLAQTIQQIAGDDCSSEEKQNEFQEAVEDYIAATSLQLEVYKSIQLYVCNFRSELRIPEDAPQYVKDTLRRFYEQLVLENANGETESTEPTLDDPTS